MASVVSAPSPMRKDNRQHSPTGKSQPASDKLPRFSDPDGLEEYSVVYTNRSLNHMSAKFQQVMRDVSATLKQVHGAHSTALVPGSGTFAMEAVARQFGTGRKCLVLRNGLFSYRWSQIFEMGSIPSEEIVLKARPVDGSATPAYEPMALDEVVETIRRERPAVVFAPHVETSAGIMLPDAYIKGMTEAVHEVGGLFVLDCIASGCIWVNMSAVGVDVIIGAPQKSWSGSPCAGMVLMNKAARTQLDNTVGTSFSVDLKKWVAVMEAYEQGGHMYHTTMPTDAIIRFRDAQSEAAAIGFERLKQEQLELGAAVRRLLAKRGFKSVAAEGYGAPGVVVSYTDDPDLKSGAKFAAQGMQIAAGVPLMVDDFTQSAQFRTFRLGLFGMDKLSRIPKTVSSLERAMDAIAAAAFPEGHQTSRL
mmetsp:Transcript_87428/g.187543  ORF Transcript_87428/g.187543 Transcript_87428/m.187543 type:complete len:419 (-) Transcript_87428:80-1336(-)